MRAKGTGFEERVVNKTIRSKMIQRIQTTRYGSTSQSEKTDQDARKIEESRRRKGQSGTISKVPKGRKKNRRVGPGGKIAMVSDGAVESIVADMERRTRKAIRIIGLSRGF